MGSSAGILGDDVGGDGRWGLRRRRATAGMAVVAAAAAGVTVVAAAAAAAAAAPGCRWRLAEGKTR